MKGQCEHHYSVGGAVKAVGKVRPAHRHGLSGELHALAAAALCAAMAAGTDLPAVSSTMTFQVSSSSDKMNITSSATDTAKACGQGFASVERQAHWHRIRVSC